jgi:hypothetical protein
MRDTHTHTQKILASSTFVTTPGRYTGSLSKSLLQVDHLLPIAHNDNSSPRQPQLLSIHAHIPSKHGLANSHATLSPAPYAGIDSRRPSARGPRVSKAKKDTCLSQDSDVPTLSVPVSKKKSLPMPTAALAAASEREHGTQALEECQQLPPNRRVSDVLRDGLFVCLSVCLFCNLYFRKFLYRCLRVRMCIYDLHV